MTGNCVGTTIAGSAFGMRIIGGKSIPNTNGMIGAFVAKILPGGVVDTLGEVREGNQVLEWNGVPLTGKTHDEVQAIIKSSLNSEEVELVVRADDINSLHEPFFQDEQTYAAHAQTQQQQQQQQYVSQNVGQNGQHQGVTYAQMQHHNQQTYDQLPHVQIDGPMLNEMTATSKT